MSRLGKIQHGTRMMLRMCACHRYSPEIPEPCYLDSGMGSGLYVTCMYCGLSLRQTPRRRTWIAVWHVKIVDTFICVFSCVCGWQKPEDPKLSLMADAITWGGIGGLVSLVYIMCGACNSKNITEVFWWPSKGQKFDIYPLLLTYRLRQKFLVLFCFCLLLFFWRKTCISTFLAHKIPVEK